MPRIVRGALLQATWTGDKESMIQKHEGYAHEAAKQGAQVMLFQELFYGPYFCQVQETQYYGYTELIPDGPTTKRMQDLAKQTGMVLVVPMYEEDCTPPASTTTPPPSSTPTASTWASTARRTSRTSRASGRSSTSAPATSATRCSRPRSARSACTSATTATSRRAPGRWASTAPRWCSSRQRHQPRPVRVPVADRAGQPRRRQRLLRRHHQPGRHRGRDRRRRLLRPELLRAIRAASSSARVGSRPRRGADRPGHGPRHDRARSARPGSSTATAGPRCTGTSSSRSGRPGRTARSAPGPVRYDPARLGCQGGGQPSRLILRGSPQEDGDAVRVHAQAGPLDRAHDRAHQAGRGGGLRLRLAVRQPRPVAGPVPAADAHGPGDDDDAPRAPASPTRPPGSPPSRRRRWPCSTSCPAGAWTSASGAATPPGGSWARPRRR